MTGPLVRRVVVVDDHEPVRRALCSMIKAHPDLEVVADAADGIGGVAAVLAHEPDVALLDVRMPVMDGLEAAQRILEQLPDTRIVILSAYDDPSIRRDALSVGANAFLCKGEPARTVHAALLGAE